MHLGRHSSEDKPDSLGGAQALEPGGGYATAGRGSAIGLGLKPFQAQ
jgi:hypothetical protein